MNNKCRDCKDRPTQLEKFDSLIQKAKAYSVVFISGVIILGILIVFYVSISDKEVPGIEEMNQFVSIVLGVVATIVSIVSMLFSFYGLEKTEESERRQKEILDEIITIEKETRRSTQAIESSIQAVRVDSKIQQREKDVTFNNESNPADED